MKVFVIKKTAEAEMSRLVDDVTDKQLKEKRERQRFQRRLERFQQRKTQYRR